MTAAPSAPASLQQLLKQARASGSLNLTSKGLEEVPEQVFNLLGEEGGLPSPVTPFGIMVQQYVYTTYTAVLL